MTRQIPFDKPAELIALVRRTESGGLAAVLRMEPQHALTGEDIRSTPFQLEFPVDATGTIKPLELGVRIECPEFEPKAAVKTILLPPTGDSEACTFLITPLSLGELRVNMELTRGDGLVTSRALKTEAEILVSIPLSVLVHAPGQTAAPLAPAFTPGSSLDEQFASLYETAEPPRAAKPEPPAPEPPGEFTQWFEASEAAPSSEPPGEFTRYFEASSAASKPAPTAPELRETVGRADELLAQGDIEVAPGNHPAASPPAGEPPGEFTRYFEAQSAASKPAPPVTELSETVGRADELLAQGGIEVASGNHAPASPPAGEPPGEFTTRFEAAHAGASPSEPPGEFTRYFGSPSAASKPAPPVAELGETVGRADELLAQGDIELASRNHAPASPPADEPPGEFTTRFEAARAGASPSEPPGEFTRYFAAASEPTPKSPDVPEPLTSGTREDDEFNRVFGLRDVPAPQSGGPPKSVPPSPSPPPVPVQEEPDEFNRKFSVPAPLPRLGQPSPDAPKPQPHSALPEAPARLPLILGLVGVGIFAVALILFLVFRSRS
jgi:hypothetical protein